MSLVLHGVQKAEMSGTSGFPKLHVGHMVSTTAVKSWTQLHHLPGLV